LHRGWAIGHDDGDEEVITVGTNQSRLRSATALLALGVLTGCSSGGQAETPHADEFSTLAGCGPLETAYIEKTAAVTGLQSQSSPTICSWVGLSTASDGGIIDISYSWLKKNSLMFDRQTADGLGYRTEAFVTKSFGGFYWHDPHDPATCGASAADAGTVTWWVTNHNHSARPDPCAAAFQLIFETVKLDG
jgi:hypothetical protein